MTSPTTQYALPSRLGLYEPIHQIGLWEGAFESNISPGSSGSITTGAETKLEDKIQKRLAQNREAARKSRMRKKAYVQQLETERVKLARLELELEKARHHGMFTTGATTGHIGSICGSVNSGISAFEMEYGHWIDDQERKISELRNGLQLSASDAELSLMVASVLSHYCDLFRLKREAARMDAFYLVSGMWRTSVERFFLWIGGFRPSVLITIVKPHLEPLSEQQAARIDNLRCSCLQAEDALSQGMEKLQQTLAQSLLAFSGGGSYSSQTAAALENLESLEGFVHQADHLREQTLHQMSRILTTRQAAKGLVAFGDYFQRLRALSALWTARCPRETD